MLLSVDISAGASSIIAWKGALLCSLDADPSMLFFDVDGDGAEACGAEDGLEGLWRRIVEVIVLDVLLDFGAEARMVVDLGDEQEGAALLEDAADFLEVSGESGQK